MTLSRVSVAIPDTWDLTPLYPSVQAWEEDFKTINFEPLAALKGTASQGPKAIRKIFEVFFALERKVRKLYTWAHLASDVELTVEETRTAYSKVQSIGHLFAETAAWIEPEILSLPDAAIEEALQSQELQEYQIYLKKLVRQKPHTLSEREEQLLALADEPLSKVYGTFRLFNDADLKFGTVKDSLGDEKPLTHASYSLFVRSTDRTLRENAFKQLHNKFSEFQNTLAELLSGQSQTQIFQAKARKYSSALHAALFPKNVPESVYNNLITSVRKEIGALHAYFDLKKRVHKLDQFHLYDVSAPMIPQAVRTYPFEEAVQLIIDSVAPLGTEYQEVLRKGLTTERWTDRYENQNKRSGAYSSGCFDSYPYMLMNYTGKLRDVFTLAHEAGHSMHSYLSNKHQPYHYSNYPIFVAEVASTCNEELLLQHMLSKSTSPLERAYLLSEKLEDIRGTLFRQTMFAEFEKTIHANLESRVPLTPNSLKTLYMDLNHAYFGDAVTVDEEIGSEWARIPHFYYNFYVYQYATGISAALALADDILSKKEGAQKRYLEFLSSGSRDFPIALLQKAGVDMESPVPIEKAIARFRTLTNQLEKELLALDMI